MLRLVLGEEIFIYSRWAGAEQNNRPLPAKSCQMVRGRFLALRPGIAALREIWLDLGARQYPVKLL